MVYNFIFLFLTLCAIIYNIGDNMNSIWKTLLIYLPFMILLMIFYWRINDVEIEYPSITINGKDVIYDINYKYKTTLIPFIYSYTKEDRQPNYIDNNIPIEKVKINTSILLNVEEMKYNITNMYIVYEDEELTKVYEGDYSEDITKYFTKPGVYRISLFSKLYKRFYYDGYVDYKFKIEVAE